MKIPPGRNLWLPLFIRKLYTRIFTPFDTAVAVRVGAGEDAIPELVRLRRRTTGKWEVY
jgi:hypothetical protein